MNDSMQLILLLLVCSIVLVLLVALLLILGRSQSIAVKWLQTLLKQQVVENQRLRNQILAMGDPNLLNALNHLTLPNKEDPEPEIIGPGDLDSDIANEDELAKQGFQPGEISDDLTSAGWSPPFYAGDEDGTRTYSPY